MLVLELTVLEIIGVSLCCIIFGYICGFCSCCCKRHSAINTAFSI